MVFPEDQIKDLRRVEEHSLVSVVVVSVSMIAAAIVGLSVFMA
ncbi:MAG TPA: hypothetical protein VLQ68_02280 [Rhizobiaceae bacterium]|nr:hypothetical protein [Rhizobiaceae bacterium]